MFVQRWELDFQMGLFGKDYFQRLVKTGQLKEEEYNKVTGEDYVAQQAQSQTEQPQA